MARSKRAATTIEPDECVAQVGAILFNLGLIAEAEGAREQAVVYYRESLTARPANRAVERELAKLRVP